MELDTKEEKQQQDQDFHVLAVDDSLTDRKLLEKLLSFSSYKVTCVDSGDKALKYLGLADELEKGSSTSSQQPEGLKVHLILTDYCMPGMTGYDLLKKVKGSSWKDVPVVVMSSENVPSRISMCLEEGAEEFMLKPLQSSDLERLHLYLLKSVGNNSDKNENCSDNEIINKDNKRRAISPDNSLEQRPKFEGLAAV